MTQYCEGANSATIKIHHKGKLVDTVKSDNPAVSYEITQSSPPCWYYGGEGLKSDCSASGVVYRHHHRGKKPEFEVKVVPPGQAFAGCSYAFVILDGVSKYPSLAFGAHPATYFVERDDSGDCGDDSSEPGYTVKITDESGVIYEKFFPGDKEPVVEVSCDDECPEGYIKCSSDKYPGYCCIPCKETASKIRAIGNKL